MAGDSITSANSVFTLVVPGLFQAPVQMKGYSSDKAFMVDSVVIAEANRGVDGRLTAGYVFNMNPQTITLQADSPSRDFFSIVIAASKATKDVYYMSGTITLPSTREVFTLTRGVLANVKQIPEAAKVLQPVDYQIIWEDVTRNLF
jgi:hypothetical protein